MPSRDPRSIIAQPSWGILRQGTVFSGAIADHYENCEVFGIVITAHCDLQHGKTGIVNYLPVVHMSDWLCRDFALSLVDRIRSSVRSQLADLLRAEGHSPTILDVQDRNVVVETLFPPTIIGKSVRRGAKARDAVASLDLLDQLDSPPLTEDQLIGLQDIAPKAASGMKRECLRNSLNGYYFLSHIDPAGDHSGFVVLLRQIYHLPLSAALAVAEGLHLDGAAPLAAVATLAQDPDGFAMPIGQLASPYLEHLMQSFAALFARIGVPDLPDEFQTNLTGV